MGLTEANQTYLKQLNIMLLTDGGLKTERYNYGCNDGRRRIWNGHIIFSCHGCIMVRQCHSNTCPVGVFSQDEDLRKNYWYC